METIDSDTAIEYYLARLQALDSATPANALITLAVTLYDAALVWKRITSTPDERIHQVKENLREVGEASQKRGHRLRVLS